MRLRNETARVEGLRIESMERWSVWGGMGREGGTERRRNVLTVWRRETEGGRRVE